MPAMKEMVDGVDRYRHFINGQWVDSTVKEWIEVENPGDRRDHRHGAEGDAPTMPTARWWPPRRRSRPGRRCRRSSAASC